MEPTSKEYVSISHKKLRSWILSETNRKNGGKSQTSLAKELDINQGTVSIWCSETGKDSLRPESILAISKYRCETYEDTLKFLQDWEDIDSQLPSAEKNWETRLESIESTISVQSQMLGELLVTVRVLGEEIQKLKQKCN